MKRQSSSPLEPSSQSAAAAPAPAPTPSIAPAPATGTDLASSPSPSPPPAATPLKSVPVTIISGFLIAGKTLLSYAHTAHHGPRIIVIDNEVGGEIDVKSLIVIDGDNGNVFEKSTSTATAALAARYATTLPTRSNGPPSPAKPDSAESRPRTRRKEAPAGPVSAAATRDRVAPVRDVIHHVVLHYVGDIDRELQRTKTSATTLTLALFFTRVDLELCVLLAGEMLARTENQELRRCGVCDKKAKEGTELRRCARCKCTFYCDGER